MSQLHILASAYACEPGSGSEPGIGWNVVRELARDHRVWVLTREDNRPPLEEELRARPIPNLEPVYFDLPDWASTWKSGTRGLQAYYYLWQIGAYWKARRLIRRIELDLVHHVTFGRYWNPSFLSLLPLPFVWGPVGGGESMPSPFWREIGWRGLLYETVRSTARRLGEMDPFVRMTARRSRVALATTDETAESLKRLGPEHVLCLGNVALGEPDLSKIPFRDPPSPPPVRFISAGRLLHWKGFHLGLRAFARADLADSEYWIVGNGPDRERLERRARELGVRDRVRFWGKLSRTRTLECLAKSHALVHPSLHDSGGWVCAEAMATGRPVVCLDLGGPARVVTEDTGRIVRPGRPASTVTRLADALGELYEGEELRGELGERARRRVTDQLTWRSKADRIERAYELALSKRRSRSR